MRVLVAFDKFKDTLSAQEVCQTIVETILNFNSSIECKSTCLSDGGEGFVDAFATILNVTPLTHVVTGPLGHPVGAEFILTQIQNKLTAIIEIAKCAGLELVPMDQRNPLNCTTTGIGQLMCHAVSLG
jgi:glycerate 2-kinase